MLSRLTVQREGSLLKKITSEQAPEPSEEVSHETSKGRSFQAGEQYVQRPRGWQVLHMFEEVTQELAETTDSIQPAGTFHLAFRELAFMMALKI